MIQKNNTKGFTLLEVMVALAILAIASSSLLIIRNNAVEDSLRAIRTRQMQNLLEKKMAEAVSGIENRRSGDFERDGFAFYEWEIKENPKILSATSPDTNKPFQVAMKEIQVIVYYKENRDRKYSLTTLVLLEKPDGEQDEKK